ncbi:ABC transporter permease subunit [Sphingomonas flavalba]|uniref:ABC transporter permease subunit n=1 Tax=Sphingomonas flavalba TaxID=2559804 RepID=UPI0039E15247
MWAGQAAILLGIAALVAAIAATTARNLDRLGIQHGFDFLFQPAGFDLGTTLLPFTSTSPVYMAFLAGIANTLVLTVLAIALSTLIALVVALLCMSGDRLLGAIGWSYVEIFRNIPALLQIFVCYFVVLRALPAATDSLDLGGWLAINNRGIFLPAVGIGGGGGALVEALGLAALFAGGAIALRHRARRWLVLLGLVVVVLWAVRWATVAAPTLGRFGYESRWEISPELCALVLGLAVYNASYIAEIIRSGINAVPRGQWEAARALGFSPAQTLRRIVFPQALRVILPPMANAYLNVLKASSLGAAVAYPEVVSVMVGTTNNIVGRPIEIMALTLVTYLLISLLVAFIMHRIDRRVGRSPAL